MQHIETVTVGSGGAALIEFTSIPQTFTDLYLVCSTRTTRTNSVLGVIIIKPNSNDGTLRRLYGTGSAAASASGSTLIAATSTNAATASTFGSFSVYIPNYTSAVAKSISIDSVGENNGTEAWSWIAAGLSNTTSAINSLTLDGENGDFVEYSTATLYGILAGSDGIVAVS